MNCFICEIETQVIHTFEKYNFKVRSFPRILSMSVGVLPHKLLISISALLNFAFEVASRV